VVSGKPAQGHEVFLKGVIVKKLSFLFFPLLFLALFAFLTEGKHPENTQPAPSIQEEYVADEVLVKFKKETNRMLVQQGIDLVQGRIETYLGREISPWEWDAQVPTSRSFLNDPDLFHIKVPAFIGTEQAIYVLSMNPYVEYAEKNYVVHATERITNDTHFPKLWGLRNTGQSGGTGDADIDASNAWDIHTGSMSVVVAIIDTGVDYNYLDLQANIWSNPGETGGGKENNGVDDDGNGYIDDWHGWNFVNGNNNPMDTYSDVYNGTHVAGTIGAKGNNGKGIAGVDWNAIHSVSNDCA